MTRPDRANPQTMFRSDRTLTVPRTTPKMAANGPQAGKSRNGHPIFGPFYSIPRTGTAPGGYIPGGEGRTVPSKARSRPQEALTPGSGPDIPSAPLRPVE